MFTSFWPSFYDNDRQILTFSHFCGFFVKWNTDGYCHSSVNLIYLIYPACINCLAHNGTVLVLTCVGIPAQFLTTSTISRT